MEEFKRRGVGSVSGIRGVEKVCGDRVSGFVGGKDFCIL